MTNRDEGQKNLKGHLHWIKAIVKMKGGISAELVWFLVWLSLSVLQPDQIPNF